MIIKIGVAAAAAADLVNAVTAIYVGVRGTAATPPNLNADLLDYYLYSGLQLGVAGVGTPTTVHSFDIRTKRRLRGDRDLFWRITNNEVTPLQIGMEGRFLLSLS